MATGQILHGEYRIEPFHSALVILISAVNLFLVINIHIAQASLQKRKYVLLMFQCVTRIMSLEKPERLLILELEQRV